MDGARWELAKDLFHAALDQPTAERTAWLTRQTDDAHVLAEVRGLLAGHATATATSKPVDDPVVSERYRVLREIGRGGFGTVHLAEQIEPVRRRVALKVLRVDLAGALVVQRFERERQALARMSHPSIAQILDAGATADGRPFFVMEYVEGAPLVRYCDDCRMPVAERLRLFVQVCRGVHHAHQKGVVRRDLKPSNVLVATIDGVAAPKIIDFGIAKAMFGDGDASDGPWPTIEGRCLGTPGYMPPGQADLGGGQVDARSDVYSLGVLLHELLIGRLPHDPGSARSDELFAYLRAVRERDAARPSLAVATRDTGFAAARATTPGPLRKLLRGDLDWITLRALERDPTRRYQSANDIAEELERHLRHEPVQAGPPNASYRLAKFVRRHRVGAASAAAILVALMVGLVAMLWQNRIAEAALTEAVGHRLSAQAMLTLDEDPTLALLMAIAGAERAPAEDADAALFAALDRCHEVRSRVVHDDAPRWAVRSADDRTLLTGDDSGLVLCTDLADGTVRHRLELHDAPLLGIAMAAHGRLGGSFDAAGSASVSTSCAARRTVASSCLQRCWPRTSPPTTPSCC